MRKKCVKTLLFFSLTVAAVLVVRRGLLRYEKQSTLPPSVDSVGFHLKSTTASTAAPRTTSSTTSSGSPKVPFNEPKSFAVSADLSVTHPSPKRRGRWFPDHDTLPFRKYLKTIEELEDSTRTWAGSLHHFLSTVDKDVSPMVNLVIGDYKHRMLVLNWVVAATVRIEPPLDNVIVISLQHGRMCDFIANSTYMSHPSRVTCIVIPVNSIISLKTKDDWVQSLMIRPFVVRLINYWGYDVATYDSDAVVLKNPQELFKQHPQDIMSAADVWPTWQAQPWGLTLCAGAMVYRASATTADEAYCHIVNQALTALYGCATVVFSFSQELLWRSIANVTGRDDQVVLNTALMNMKVTWKRTTSVGAVCSTDGWEGESSGGLSVYVFPARLWCRGHCCGGGHRPGLYVVHPSGTHGAIRLKSRVLDRAHAWFISTVTKELASPD